MSEAQIAAATDGSQSPSGIGSGRQSLERNVQDLKSKTTTTTAAAAAAEAYTSNQSTKLEFSTSKQTSTPLQNSGGASQIFSPKRKRSQTPLREGIPETPWRELSTRDPRQEIVKEDENSPRSWRLQLERQFEEMSLGVEKDGDADLEILKVKVDGPIAKKQRRAIRGGTGGGRERAIGGTKGSSPDNEEEEESMELELEVSSSTEQESKQKQKPKWKPTKEKKPVNGSGQRKRLKSPPLSKTREMISEQVEETGGIFVKDDEEDVDSDDPEKDGIDIPTPTQRYVRSQKRLQQIKEYKAREAREAREKRKLERSRRKGDAVDYGSPVPEKSDDGGERKAVHFVV
ncbi:hypothetical protein RUND412_004552 [Rhizina undulata]